MPRFCPLGRASLRRFLFFAHKGHVRRSTDQAACLTLLTNAVIVWNTVYMARRDQQLAIEGLIDPPTPTSPATLSAGSN